MGNNNTKVTTGHFDGREVDIHVTSAGKFTAVLNGHEYEATTLDLLNRKLTAAVRVAAVRVALKATRLNRTYGTPAAVSAEPVTITGIHARNKNPLVKGANGKTEQDSSYGTKFLRELTAAEHKQFDKLRDAYTEAKRQYDDWVSEREIQPKQAIRAALKEQGVAADQIDEMVGAR